MTDYLTHDCINVQVDWTYNLTGDFGLDGSWPNATMCGYFLNFTQTPILMSGYIVDNQSSNVGDALVMRTVPMFDVMSKAPIVENGSIHFAHIRNSIVGFSVASAADGTTASIYRNETPVVNKCVLAWCVKTVQSSIEGGIYKEEITGVQFNTTSGPHPWTTIDVTTPWQNGTEITYNEDIVITTESDQVFGMTNGTVPNVMLLFGRFIPSTLSTKDNAAVLILRYTTWLCGPAYNRKLLINPWLAPNNISAHMSRMATALTNQIRTVGSGNEDVRGTAHSQEVYIRVQWAWFAFPATLLVLSLVFLVATIMKTSNDTGGNEMWKTSAMPTLIYGYPKKRGTSLRHRRGTKHAMRRRSCASNFHRRWVGGCLVRVFVNHRQYCPCEEMQHHLGGFDVL